MHIRSGGPTWVFAKKRFTFFLGRGVGHVPGAHKPHFRAFQTHSFSENQKINKSTKYKYIFGSTEVDEKYKIFKISSSDEPPDTYQIPTGTYVRPLQANRVHTNQKSMQHFCIVFFTHPNAFLTRYICSSTTK